MSNVHILNEYLSYDPDIGILRWKKSPAKRIISGSIAGYINGNGYVVFGLKRKYYLGHRVAWFLFYGEWPSLNIDHIDRCGSNNRIINLRDVTQIVNLQNRSMISNNYTGLVGAYFNKSQNRYYSHIKKNDIVTHLGCFDTAIEAHNAYLSARKRLDIIS